MLSFKNWLLFYIYAVTILFHQSIDTHELIGGESLTMIDSGEIFSCVLNSNIKSNEYIDIYTSFFNCSTNEQLDQMRSMEMNIKRIVLRLSKPCQELHQHLNSTSKSLDWIGQQGAITLLKLALLMDETFGPELLSLMLKQ